VTRPQGRHPGADDNGVTNTATDLDRLYSVATDAETSVIDEVARRAGIHWHCGCGWHNPGLVSHCEDCDDPAPLKLSA
jgi:hypothetical protein